MEVEATLKDIVSSSPPTVPVKGTGVALAMNVWDLSEENHGTLIKARK